ncbi:right-handed parallel beta-helix repeat-containing protein [Micromonospora echinaurantiaca]|uniref:right-handed parallel beta-helix repeat-containing protein n=1 Tax=Micromonospora echinaurantiaca TaxID=47857 RepID=UPI00371D03A4
MSSANCVPDGNGTEAAPFCTISAAAAVVEPGQTVLVQPGTYLETVSVARSGTESAPITFRAVHTPDGMVRVGRVQSTTVSGTIFTLSGVHDVVVEGFTVVGGGPGNPTPVVVDDSSGITLDGLSIHPGLAPVGVQVTGGSRNVTVSRNWIKNVGSTGVLIEPGTEGARVTANQIPMGQVRVIDAPGTVVANNTVVTPCGPGISIEGASPGASVENNIVKPITDPVFTCQDAPKGAISVAATSTPETITDYNLIDPTNGEPPYVWGGTSHATLSDFRAATGQGEHDIAADPKLDLITGGDRAYIPLLPGSPAIDSGTATARGRTATDLLGNPHLDDPAVVNTGTGNGYHDRGAVERISTTSWATWPLQRPVGGGPLDATSKASHKYLWEADGSGGTFAYKFSDSRFWTVSRSPEASHRFRRAGTACVQRHYNNTGFRGGAGGRDTSCTALGAHYTPLPPTRLLDTRAAIGVSTRVPVAPNSDVVLPIESIGGVVAADISAVVLNVTVTQPTASGFLTVYPGDVGLPNASNVNFVAKETVPNLVAVPMTNGTVRIRNGSSGTVHVIADLQGYYSGAGTGFTALTPQRVLDTRSGGVGPFAANSTRQVDLAGRIPADATAVVLNVTVTAPTANGVLTVFPAGGTVPATSNLNFVTGQTIPNLVMVPVVAGKVDIRNASSGATHVIADLAGWFGPSGRLSYVPKNPARILDTRYGIGAPNRRNAPLAPHETISVYPLVSAVVANLTVTAPTAAGVLIAHPGGEPRPVASNVNFVAGETASNLAIVKTDDSLKLYNSSSGTTHAIVDQAGSFIAPPS